MSTQKIIYLIAGTILGFVVGFAFANNVNRQEQDKLREELARLRPDASRVGETATPRPGENSFPEISDEKLKDAIVKADSNPRDIEFQRTSGQGLFIIAVQTGNASILPDAARFLRRVHDADPNDYNVTVMLGNAHFLLGREGGGNPSQLEEARTYYQKALAAKPDDVIVRTSLGLTHFYDKPSDPRRAVLEYRKSLKIDPRHAVTLQNLVAALTAAGEVEEAAQRLAELEKVDSANGELPNLRAQLERKRNASKEKD